MACWCCGSILVSYIRVGWQVQTLLMTIFFCRWVLLNSVKTIRKNSIDWFGASVSTLAWYLINWGCKPYLEWFAWSIKKRKQFNQSDIASNIPALTLALSVNWPLHHNVKTQRRLVAELIVPSMRGGRRSLLKVKVNNWVTQQNLGHTEVSPSQGQVFNS